MPLVRICGGGYEQSSSLLRPGVGCRPLLYTCSRRLTRSRPPAVPHTENFARRRLAAGGSSERGCRRRSPQPKAVARRGSRRPESPAEAAGPSEPAATRMLGPADHEAGHDAEDRRRSHAYATGRGLTRRILASSSRGFDTPFARPDLIHMSTAIHRPQIARRGAVSRLRSPKSDGLSILRGPRAPKFLTRARRGCLEAPAHEF